VCGGRTGIGKDSNEVPQAQERDSSSEGTRMTGTAARAEEGVRKETAGQDSERGNRLSREGQKAVNKESASLPSKRLGKNTAGRRRGKSAWNQGGAP